MEDETQIMQMETVQGRDLTYLTVYPQEYDPALDYPLVILLHGFGANMYDLSELSKLIDTTGYIYACPNAPISIQLEPDMVGFAWTEPMNDDPQQVINAERKLNGFFEEVMEKHGIAPGRSLLLGFSQGGTMTYRCGLSRPDLFAGLVALSCSIRNPDEARKTLPMQRNQPIFIAHGLRDNIERAQSSMEFLQVEGYTPTYNEYDMAHEISQEVIRDLVPWIHKVLPPLRLD
jgi:phospholipase/carboxylesterase